MGELVVVGAAIIEAGKVLACRRSEPPALAGGWEFPGGKVEPGEDERDALIRECDEELGVAIELGERVGPDVPLSYGTGVLKVWAAKLTGGEPEAREHDELRWLGVDELDTVAWLPGDLPIVDALRTVLP